MQTFHNYISEQGVQDIENLMGFVDTFLDDPSIFFDLSESQRHKIEKDMDIALNPFRNNPQ